MKRRIPIILAGVALGVAGFSIPATSAFAAGTPSANCPIVVGAPNNNAAGTAGDQNPGGDCTVSGTVTIGTALSIATNLTAFSLNSASLNAETDQGDIIAGSNVPTGYYIDVAGPTGGFSSGTAVLPDSFVSGWQANGSNTGTLQTGVTCATVNSSGTPIALTATGTTFVNDPGISGNYNCASADPNLGGYVVPPGYDSFEWGGFELTGVNGTPAGVYTGTVQIDIWGT